MDLHKPKRILKQSASSLEARWQVATERREGFSKALRHEAVWKIGGFISSKSVRIGAIIIPNGRDLPWARDTSRVLSATAEKVVQPKVICLSYSADGNPILPSADIADITSLEVVILTETPAMHSLKDIITEVRNHRLIPVAALAISGSPEADSYGYQTALA